MTKTKRPGFRSRLRPEWAGPALGLLVAASLAAAPAAAADRGASLSVTATVTPSCVVSTRGGSASTSCRNFGDGSFAIERDRPRDTSSDPAPSESTAIPPRPGNVTYLTITY